MTNTTFTNENGVARVTISRDTPTHNGTPEQKSQTASVLPGSLNRTGGAMRVVIGEHDELSTGWIPKGSSARSTATQQSSNVETQDILATARSSGGARGVLNANSIVTIGDGNAKQDVPIEVAVRMGLLAKDDQGRYYQPNRQSDSVQRNLTAEEQLQEVLQRQQQPEADDSGTDKVPDLAPELHEMATNFVQSTDNLTVTSATREMIDTGGLSDQTVTSIATQMGLEPDEVRNRATALNNALLSQARDLTAAHIGTPEAADDVFAWAREHAPSLLRDAIQDHVNNEQSGGYARLARAYLEVLPERNPEMILNSPDAKARDIKRDHNGVITVAIEGAGRVEWRVAVRQGLIAPRWRMD